MTKIHLLIANSSKYFTDTEVDVFHKAVEESEIFLSKHFNLGHDVDIVVTSASSLMDTIPEDGISARTYNSRLIIIAIDKSQAPIVEDIIFETVCHEMSHSIRWESQSEYSDTLFKGLILEGLAVVLEEMAMTETDRHNKQFFLKTILDTDDEMIELITSELSKDFDNTKYDYNSIFYTGDDTLPRWAGYRLGYRLVKHHMEHTNQSIADVTLAKYDTFKKTI